MNEEYFDSSVNEYIIKEETESYKRQTYWDMAIGLQKVDNLKPSKYLENLTEENIIGKKTIKDSLEYDLSIEKEKDYKDMNIVDIISNITDFTSRIWQVHPFREGNTRTTAVFIEKYLRSLGYEVDNTLFKDKSFYFRNALVRSNCYNSELNIKTDSKYLTKFYENLLLGKTNNLHSEDLIVKELTNK